MSTNDGPSPEMRLFTRPELDQPLSAADAERLLAGQGAAPDAPKDQQALAMMLRHAAAPAQTQELAGQDSAIAAFAQVKEQKTRRAEGPVPAAGRHRQARAAGGRRWTQARRRPLVAACASAAVLIALSGTAAADALPAPIQKVAHDTFGAPAPRHPAPSVTTTPGPRPGKQPPATPDATPQKPNNSETPHGNGKAIGKAKPATARPAGHAQAGQADPAWPRQGAHRGTRPPLTPAATSLLRVPRPVPNPPAAPPADAPW